MEVPTALELLNRFTYYDYAVFVCMLSVSGAIGVFCAFHGGPQNTIRQLLTGNKSLPVLPVGTSLVASFISAAYLLGGASEVYRHGTMYAMLFLAYALTIPLTAHVYMPVFYNLQVTTAYQYLELRFNRSVRTIVVALYTVEMTVYIAISLYAPALALSQLTGMTLWSAVAAIGIVCTVYTSIGGIKAVVYTDTFQTVVTVLAMLAVVLIGFQKMGGFGRVWNIARNGSKIEFDNISIDPTVRHTIWSLTLGGFFTTTASYATSQMMVLRYLTVPTLRDAKLVIWLNLPFLCIILLLSCLAGLLVYAKYATCDPIALGQISSNDQLLPYFVMDVLGKMTGIPGLFVAGIFAASLSSISSGVNALASVFYVDIIALLKEDIPDKVGARIINALGVFFGLLSIGLVALASQMGNVLAVSSSTRDSVAQGLSPESDREVGGLEFVEAEETRRKIVQFFRLRSINSGPYLLACVRYSSPRSDGIASLCVNSAIGGPLLGVFTLGMFVPSANSKGALAGLLASLALSLWMTLGSFVQPAAHEPLPLQGCWEGNFTSNYAVATSVVTGTNTNILNVYKLSYLWYSMIATTFALVVGITVSHLTTPTKVETLNPKLVCSAADAIFWFLPEKLRRPLRSNVGIDYVPACKLSSAKPLKKEVVCIDFIGKQTSVGDACRSKADCPLYVTKL